MSDGESSTARPLRAHYLAYLAALNERRFEDLPAFVADDLVYNDAPMTRGQYRELLEDDVRRIPDLVFHVQVLVVDEAGPHGVTGRVRRARPLPVPRLAHHAGVVPARPRGAGEPAACRARLTRRLARRERARAAPGVRGRRDGCGLPVVTPPTGTAAHGDGRSWLAGGRP